MKIKHILLVICSLSILTGCESWLDVKPRTQVREDDIYSSELGFKEVMNGIYISMGSKELYGLYTTAYFNDLLARLWNPSSSSSATIVERAIFDYKFTNKDVADVIDAIWKKYYKAISDINNLLENIENTNVRFEWGNRELIMGECYGTRAYLHFELLRLFGPVPSTAKDSDEGVPYVTQLTKDPNKLISNTYGEVKRMILEDLDRAEQYLKNDPFTKGSMYDFNNPNNYDVEYVPDDEWHYKRQTHFNIYTVDALRARFYQWTGEKERATELARKVIGIVNTDASPKFALATESNTYGNSHEVNLVMRCEHIFAVHSSNQQVILGDNNIFRGANPKLSQSNTNVNNIFESSVSPSDSRNVSNRYWTSGTMNNMEFLKYLESGNIKPLNMVPLIRVAEMYLILIENLQLEEAKEVFNTFRQARSMSTNVEIETETARTTRVETEYRKEFFGEGQLWFFYKRINKATITVPGRFNIPAGGYVIPKPDSQKAFE